MLTSITLGIVFRIINLGVLLGIAAYVYKKYLKPDIKKDIANDELMRVELQDQSRQFVSKRLKEERADFEQQELFLDLKSKIDEWVNHTRALINERKEERDRLERLLHARAHRRAENAVILETERAVVPEAMKDARAKLSAEFAGKAGDAYVAHVVATMKREVS